MRELERDLPATSDATLDAPAAPTYLAVVGPGRAGRSIARAASSAGLEVTLLGRDETPAFPEPAMAAVLLCVRDAGIADACERIAPALDAGTAVGHVSGATTLEALAAAVRPSRSIRCRRSRRRTRR